MSAAQKPEKRVRYTPGPGVASALELELEFGVGASSRESNGCVTTRGKGVKKKKNRREKGLGWPLAKKGQAATPKPKGDERLFKRERVRYTSGSRVALALQLELEFGVGARRKGGNVRVVSKSGFFRGNMTYRSDNDIP
ncbi:unnamed protein product [Dovyalis caffra]|uniref:Uncharacterized protein n=1 Tax=Dovyalis caffra TaxID=77055 RepID=A0AAV1SC87_9ROSI|nr:unnamed protein product [Dovyalis caffra]